MPLTEEQRAERQGYIGGTDAAAVLGLSRYKTPLGLWSEKTGAIVPAAKKDGELPIWIGNRLEDVIAERFTFETGIKVQRVKEVQVHPRFPFLRAQIDRRLVGSNEILECKTASAFKAGEWDGEDLPSEYILQALHQLMVTGAERCHLACLIGGNVDFVRKVVERDEQMIADLEAKEVEFWNRYVQGREMPKVIAHDAGTLAALFPNARETEEPIALSEHFEAIIDRIKEIGTEKTGLLGELMEEKAELENEVRMALQDSPIGVVGRWKATWKNQDQNRLDMKRLGEEMPEVWAKYLNTSTIRVLRISDTTKAKKGAK